MLAAQMAGIHTATMRMMERLANADDIPGLDSTERAFNNLARTFAGQVEALKRYRTDTEQNGAARVGQRRRPSDRLARPQRSRLRKRRRS
jgi:hypothetical protein